MKIFGVLITSNQPKGFSLLPPYDIFLHHQLINLLHKFPNPKVHPCLNGCFRLCSKVSSSLLALIWCSQTFSYSIGLALIHTSQFFSSPWFRFDYGREFSKLTQLFSHTPHSWAKLLQTEKVWTMVVGQLYANNKVNNQLYANEILIHNLT